MTNTSFSSESEKPLVVTAAIILDRDDRILLAQRQPDAKAEASKWEFPGGKVEAFEHPEDALRREIKEELDLEIQIESIFDVSSHVFAIAGGRRHIVLLCYMCRVNETEFKLLDAADARWIDSDDLDQFDFAAPDVPVVKKLKAWFDSGSGHR